jgi:glycine hydroxymethyltransferase
MTVNKNMVPFDTRSPLITSGIRLGTAALTTKGMKEPEMKSIARFIDRVLQNLENEQILSSVLEEVKELAGQFPLYNF